MVISPWASDLIASCTFAQLYDRCPRISFFTHGYVLWLDVAPLLGPSVLGGAIVIPVASGVWVDPGRAGGVRCVLEVARSSVDCLLLFEVGLSVVCGCEGAGSVGESQEFSFLFCGWVVRIGLNGMVGEQTIEFGELCW